MTLTRIWAAIGSYVTALLIGAGAVFAVILGHKRAVSQAETRGKDETIREVEHETIKQSAKVKDEAREIQADHAGLDRDDLRDRMRSKASDRGK